MQEFAVIFPDSGKTFENMFQYVAISMTFSDWASKARNFSAVTFFLKGRQENHFYLETFFPPNLFF